MAHPLYPKAPVTAWTSFVMWTLPIKIQNYLNVVGARSPARAPAAVLRRAALLLPSALEREAAEESERRPGGLGALEEAGHQPLGGREEVGHLLEPVANGAGGARPPDEPLDHLHRRVELAPRQVPPRAPRAPAHARRTQLPGSPRAPRRAMLGSS